MHISAHQWTFEQFDLLGRQLCATLYKLDHASAHILAVYILVSVRLWTKKNKHTRYTPKA